MSKILITGGAGFIGYHLSKELAKDINNEVIILDNLQRGKIDNDLKQLLVKENVSFINGDISKYDTFEKLPKEMDYVYHLAAVIGVRIVEKRPLDVLKINSIGMINLLDWIESLDKKPRVLFSSTSEIYAGALKIIEEKFPIPTPENIPFAIHDLDSPRGTYALSKAFGEMYIKFSAEKVGFDYSIVRYHNVYGPRMGTVHVIPELMIKALNSIDEKLEVYSPSHTRAFCYVDDAVKATIYSNIKEELKNRTINIGNDMEEITIGNLANKIVKTVGKEELKTIPLQPQTGSTSRRCPNINLLKSLTDYKPLISLDEGLKATYDWYKDRAILTE